jgi:hypothetical protein
MTTKSGVFISYARKDGEQFADSLRLRLAAQAPDVRVWQGAVKKEETLSAPGKSRAKTREATANIAGLAGL